MVSFCTRFLKSQQSIQRIVGLSNVKGTDKKFKELFKLSRNFKKLCTDIPRKDSIDSKAIVISRGKAIYSQQRNGDIERELSKIIELFYEIVIRINKN